MKFKCPVCKTILNLAESAGEAIRCDSCETSFTKSKILERFNQYQKSKQGNNDSKLNSQPSLPMASKSHTSSLSTESTKSKDEVVDFTKTINTQSGNLPQQIKRRSKNNNYILIGLVVLCAGLVSTLAIVLKLPDGQPKVTSLDANEQAADIQNDLKDGPETGPDNTAPDKRQSPADRASRPRASSTIDEDESLPSSRRTPFFKLDSIDENYIPPRNRIIPKKTLNDCWFAAKPYLVELHAETPTGPKFATGTIVDSRGWVLTSFRLVENASAIHIRKARQSATADENLTTDQIRGVVAVMPKYDLALLSINRQLVNTFEDLPVASTDQVVPSQYLTMCVPPTTAYPHSTVETKTNKRSIAAELGDSNANLMSRLGLAEDIRWIVHQRQAPLSVGAPLFDDECQLVGMNISPLSGSDMVLAIPATRISEILQQENTDIQSLPLNSSSTNAPSETASDKSIEVVDANSSLRDLSENLNRLGTECDLFGWNPTSNSQDEQLRDFFEYFIAASQRISELDTTDNNAETLIRQIESWNKKMAVGLGFNSSTKRAAQEEFNRKFANPASTREEAFAGFVYVRYSAMESPGIAISPNEESTDSVVFEFKGTKRRIIANLNEDWPPLPPDSPWFVIGESVNGQIRLVSRDKPKETLGMANIYQVIHAN